jgi:class 3 adenylate cyclase
MDIHKNAKDVTLDDVVAAHVADLAVQAKYDTRYLTYWFNEDAGKIFCLVEAPSKDAANAVHKEAHGLVADELIEVQVELVDAMMGVRQDQIPRGQMLDTGEPDGGFRTIMFTDLEGSTERMEHLGDDAMFVLLARHNSIIRECLHVHAGREVKHTGDGLMASFGSVSHAVECSIAIQRAFDVHNANDPDGAMHVRIGMSAGEPIEDNKDLFGATVVLARRTCDDALPGQILTTNVVRELCVGKRVRFNALGARMLKGFAEAVSVYEVPWQAPRA